MALDLATTTGWCSHGLALQSGIYKIPEKAAYNHHKNLLWHERLQRFTAWFSNMAAVQDQDLVIEKPGMFRSRDAARVCYSLHYIVKEVAKRYRIKVAEVTPGTLKKWATGNGRAEKPEMVAAACAKAGREVLDHNEADAILLAFYGREELGL